LLFGEPPLVATVRIKDVAPNSDIGRALPGPPPFTKLRDAHSHPISFFGLKKIPGK
jgi:hypothetical protein